MNNINISDKEFLQLKDIIYKKSGIHITSDDMKNLKNKLIDRLLVNRLNSFRDYYQFLIKNNNEIQSMINAVTTNETYFFREHKHFEFLKDEVLPKVKYEKFRCWSAAGSNGAEAYSIAMHINSNLGAYQNWEVTTSDINNEVLNFAKNGIYPLRYSKKIPQTYLEQYCYKGQNEDEGFFKISDKLKRNISFEHINLMEKKDFNIGKFDLIFLRNMIIYFNDDDKKIIVENIIKYLNVGGYLFMGHSESLYRITKKVIQIRPSIYKKI